MVVLENTKKLILADPKLKLQEIGEELNISEGSVFTILHEHSSMRKLCSKWVSRLLTVYQKQHCIDDSEHSLQLFLYYKKEILHKYVTMDEMWLHHFTLESNWQSAEQPSATTGCLQTSRERDLAPNTKWYRKVRHIWRPKANHSTKKDIKLLEKHWNQCITLEGDYVDE